MASILSLSQCVKLLIALFRQMICSTRKTKLHSIDNSCIIMYAVIVVWEHRYVFTFHTTSRHRNRAHCRGSFSRKTQRDSHFTNRKCWWASYQIRKIASRMLGTFFAQPLVSDPDMHYGTCVTHVPWCMPGSLTSGFLWSRWQEKRSRHSRHMHNPQFYVSDKRPMAWWGGQE